MTAKSRECLARYSNSNVTSLIYNVQVLLQIYFPHLLVLLHHSLHKEESEEGEVGEKGEGNNGPRDCPTPTRESHNLKQIRSSVHICSLHEESRNTVRMILTSSGVAKAGL